MCQMNALGSGAMLPTTRSATNTLSGDSTVAAATGGGLPAQTTGGADLGAILTKLQSAVQALVQALGGSAQLGTTAPPTPGPVGGGDSATSKPADKPTQTDGAQSPGQGAAPARTYTVVSGDTLSKIADRFGIKDWKQLYELNKDVVGGNPDVLEVGTKLVLPDGAAEVPAPSGTGGGTTSAGGSGGNGAGPANQGSNSGSGNAGSSGSGSGPANGTGPANGGNSGSSGSTGGANGGGNVEAPPETSKPAYDSAAALRRLEAARAAMNAAQDESTFTARQEEAWAIEAELRQNGVPIPPAPLQPEPRVIPAKTNPFAAILAANSQTAKTAQLPGIKTGAA